MVRARGGGRAIVPLVSKESLFVVVESVNAPFQLGGCGAAFEPQIAPCHELLQLLEGADAHVLAAVANPRLQIREETEHTSLVHYRTTHALRHHHPIPFRVEVSVHRCTCSCNKQEKNKKHFTQHSNNNKTVKIQYFQHFLDFKHIWETVYLPDCTNPNSTLF